MASLARFLTSYSSGAAYPIVPPQGGTIWTILAIAHVANDEMSGAIADAREANCVSGLLNCREQPAASPRTHEGPKLSRLAGAVAFNVATGRTIDHPVV